MIDAFLYVCLFVCISGVMLAMLDLFSYKFRPTPKPGDVWVMDNKDPFEEPFLVKVLDVQNGYVQYAFILKTPGGMTVINDDRRKSRSVDNFKLCYRRKND